MRGTLSIRLIIHHLIDDLNENLKEEKLLYLYSSPM